MLANNSSLGGTVLWDGRFDLSTDASYKTSFASKVYSAMTSWSFSSEVRTPLPQHFSLLTSKSGRTI